MTPSGTPREDGFIAPMAAVSVALMALAAVVAADAVGSTRIDLDMVRRQTRLEAEAATAEARIVHLLLTEPLGPRGIRVGADRTQTSDAASASLPGRLRGASGATIDELVLDDRLYVVQADRAAVVEASVQDEAGLLNLNTRSELPVARALGGLGAEPTQARALASALADFTDPDDLRRMAGAEASDYRAAGLAPPRNRTLRDARGALQALGWREGLTKVQHRLLFRMAVAGSPDQPLNLNTAPSEVLEAWLGVDRRAAALLVAARASRPLQSLDDAAALTGTVLAADETPVVGRPGPSFRVTVRLRERSGARAVYQSRLTIAQGRIDQPHFRQQLTDPDDGPRSGESRNAARSELPRSPFLLAARQW